MNNLIQKDNRVNNSISADKTLGVLEILEKIRQNGSGTVSYVFVTEKLINIKANLGEKDFGATRKEIHMINAPVSENVFTQFKDGKVCKARLTDVLEVFKDTCWDRGASYFVLS